MLSIATTFTDSIQNFLSSSNVSVDNVEENFGKTVWIVQNLNDDGSIAGLLCYSFMYSTWTRYNPFILFCQGEKMDEMVTYLSTNFPGSLIRGLVNNAEDKSMYAPLFIYAC